MRTTAIHVLCCLLLAGPVSAEAPQPTTPEPGTPVRKAVCDELRKYLRYARYAELTTSHFVFKVDTMKVLGDHCVFEGYPMKPDGTHHEEVPDIDYVLFLKKNPDDKGTGWVVVADLSRSDVPAPEELREIRRSFPQEIPTAIIPEFWRKRLRGRND